MFRGYRPFLGYPSFYNALPGSLYGFGGAGTRSRLYVQLKLEPTKQHSKFVPDSCIATPTPNKFSPFRYEIIRNGYVWFKPCLNRLVCHIFILYYILYSAGKYVHSADDEQQLSVKSTDFIPMFWSRFLSKTQL